MAQVMNPQVKKDDGLNTVMSALQIYSTVSGMGKKDAAANGEKTPIEDTTEAMKRRLEQLQRDEDLYGGPEPWRK